MWRISWIIVGGWVGEGFLVLKVGGVDALVEIEKVNRNFRHFRSTMQHGDRGQSGIRLCRVKGFMSYIQRDIDASREQRGQ